MSTIHIAQVTSWGSAPVYTAVPAPPLPDPASGLVQIRVLAAAVHELVRARATGKHYTSGALPHIVGVDGVGRTVPDGETVYFITLRGRTGSFAEVVNIPKQFVFDLPAGDPAAVAAMANPTMSSWMAFKARVDTDKLPKDGWSCLIVGATSASGVIAAAVARKMGATKITGVARDAAKLAAVKDLDSSIVLADSVTDTDYSQLGEVDVILDYLYGLVTAHLLTSLPERQRPTQYVEVGAVANPEMALPAALLRSEDLTLRGAGTGSWRFDQLCEELPELLAFVGDAPQLELRLEKLSDVEKVWVEERKGQERLVFTF